MERLHKIKSRHSETMALVLGVYLVGNSKKGQTREWGKWDWKEREANEVCVMSRVALWTMWTVFHWRPPEELLLKGCCLTSSMGITWDLVRNAKFWVPTSDLLIRSSGGGAQQSVVLKPFRWFWCTLKFESLWYRTCHRIASWAIEGWWSWSDCPHILFFY